MTTFAIERRTTPTVFEAPRWADILARLWLVIVALAGWVSYSRPKAEAYLLSRYDLARKQLGPFPPVGWQIAGVFMAATIAIMWQELAVNLFSRGMGICLA